jgi:selenide, water dikinase
VLGDLPVPNDPRVLIDYRTSDDAGVYALDADRALVQTVDFFTPTVDDPFAYGQIAAANALSDVYAMGGRPLTALAIAAFPKDGERATLAAIFKGGLSKLEEAGVALLGGHTVQDSEIKFGYAVTGEVAPQRVWANAGARPGDALILTKPLGTGIACTALKFSRAPEELVTDAIRAMTTLNRRASEILQARPAGWIHGCTDVTGFGLLGHASEMAAASGCSIHLDAGAVPLLGGVLELATANVSGGGRTNRQHFGARVSIAPDVPAELVEILYDPQTSGGLLVALEPTVALETMEALAAEGVPVALIGSAAAADGPLVVVR